MVENGSQEKLAPVSESLNLSNDLSQKNESSQMDQLPFNKISESPGMHSLHSQLVMQKLVNREVLGLSADRESMNNSREYTQTSGKGFDEFQEGDTQNNYMNKTQSNYKIKQQSQLHFQQKKKKSQKAVNNIEVKIQQESLINERIQTNGFEEHNGNQRPQVNPWQARNDIQSPLRSNKNSSGNLSPRSSSQNSHEKLPSKKQPLPMTQIVANGSSLQIHSPQKKKMNENADLTKYSKGLYIKHEGKLNITSQFAGGINLSSKLNLELYKQQNQIKSPQSYGFQTEMYPSKIPQGVYSQSVMSNESSPIYTAQEISTVNLESQVNKGVQCSQIKTMKKEKNILLLKNNGIENDVHHLIANKSIKRVQKEGLIPMLNLPNQLILKQSNGPNNQNFSQLLSGKTVLLVEKPINSFINKQKKILTEKSHNRSNLDIQKIMDSHIEDDENNKIFDNPPICQDESETPRVPISLKQSKKQKNIQKEGKIPKTAEFEISNQQAALHQITKHDLKAFKVNIVQFGSRHGAAVSIQDQSLLGSESRPDQFSQVKLMTAGSEDYYFNLEYKKDGLPAYSGVKVNGSNMTFYEDEKNVEKNEVQLGNKEFLDKKKKIIKYNDALEQMQAKASNQNYGNNSQYPRNFIQNAKLGLQNFSIQHLSEVRSSREKLFNLIQNNEGSMVGLPIITNIPSPTIGSTIPRINVGFNSFGSRSKSLIEQQKGVAGRHQQVQLMKQMTQQFQSDNYYQKRGSDDRQLQHQAGQLKTSYYVAPQQNQKLLAKHREQELLIQQTLIDRKKVNKSDQKRNSSNEDKNQNKNESRQNQALQTNYESLGQAEVASKQNTLYAESTLPSRLGKNLEGNDELPLGAEHQQDKIALKQKNQGFLTMKKNKSNEQLVGDRLANQSNLMGEVQKGNIKKFQNKSRSPEQVPNKIQGAEAAYKHQERQFGVPKLQNGFLKKQNQENKTPLQTQALMMHQDSTANFESVDSSVINEIASKTFRDARNASRSSILDQILSIQESVYEERTQSRMMGRIFVDKKASLMISDRLDNRSITPTELGFVSNPKYSPVKITNIEAKTYVDSKVKPQNQNPNRQVIQQTTTVYPLESPQNLKTTYISNKKRKQNLNATIINEFNKQLFNYQQDHNQSQLIDKTNHLNQMEDKRQYEDQQISLLQTQPEIVDSGLDWNQKQAVHMQSYLNNTVNNKKQNLWSESKRALVHQDGTQTPVPESKVDMYKSKRNSNPFVSNNPNLMEVAQRFANNTNRNAAQSYHSEHTYQNAQNNSQYNNHYQYETSTQRFRKIKIVNGINDNSIKSPLPTQLEIGGEGSPMLSLLPPLITRDISPRYKQTNDRKNKAMKAVAATKEENQLAISARRTTIPKSKQTNCDVAVQNSQQIMESKSGKTLIGAGGFDIAQSGSASSKSRSNQSPGVETRLQIGSSTRKFHNEDLFQPQKPHQIPQITIDQISVLINNQSIKDFADLSQREEMNYFKQLPSISLQVPFDDSENFVRSPNQASSEFFHELTQHIRKDVVIQADQSFMNKNTAYQKRQLNLDGTWKMKSKVLKDKSFLEYINDSNFKNPLDGKNQFGFKSISPDRLILLNIITEKTDNSNSRMRKQSQNITQNISPTASSNIQMIGQKMSTQKQQSPKKIEEIKSYLPQTSQKNLAILDEMNSTKEKDENYNEYDQKQQNQSRQYSNYVLSPQISSPNIIRMGPRLRSDINPFTAVYGMTGSQISLQSNSEIEQYQQSLSPTESRLTKEQQSTMLQYSPGSKLSEFKMQLINKVKPDYAIKRNEINVTHHLKNTES